MEDKSKGQEGKYRKLRKLRPETRPREDKNGKARCAMEEKECDEAEIAR